MFEFDEEDFEYWGNYLEEQEDPLYTSKPEFFPQDGLGCALVLLIVVSGVLCLGLVFVINLIR